MSDRTAIEWTQASWNPVTGCSKVSRGCTHLLRGGGGPDGSGFAICDRFRYPVSLQSRLSCRFCVFSVGDLAGDGSANR